MIGAASVGIADSSSIFQERIESKAELEISTQWKMRFTTLTIKNK